MAHLAHKNASMSRLSQVGRSSRLTRSSLVAWLVVAGCFVVVLVALFHGVLVPQDRIRSGMVMVVIIPAYVCAARRLTR